MNGISIINCFQSSCTDVTREEKIIKLKKGEDFLRRVVSDHINNRTKLEKGF